jgi:hypothetical protein
MLVVGHICPSRNISQANATGAEVFKPLHTGLRIGFSEETRWRRPAKYPGDFVALFSHRDQPQTPRAWTKWSFIFVRGSYSISVVRLL